jgi:hypothetical protein
MAEEDYLQRRKTASEALQRALDDYRDLGEGD